MELSNIRHISEKISQLEDPRRGQPRPTVVFQRSVVYFNKHCGHVVGGLGEDRGVA